MTLRALAHVCLLAGTAVVMAACTKDDQPPHWVEACTKTETRFVLLPKGMGLGAPVGAGLQLTPQTRCIQKEPRCVWGRNYTGPKVCGSQEMKP